jgi:hypothetical protein
MAGAALAAYQPLENAKPASNAQYIACVGVIDSSSQSVASATFRIMPCAGFKQKGITLFVNFQTNL